LYDVHVIINGTPAPQPAPRTIALDTEKLYVLIDRERRRRRMTWRAVSRSLGERSPSSPARIGRGQSVSGDLLVRILAWLGWPEHQTYTSHPDFRDQG
jgi:hypothetical protein